MVHKLPVRLWIPSDRRMLQNRLPAILSPIDLSITTQSRLGRTALLQDILDQLEGAAEVVVGGPRIGRL